jgi:hypothetical protein
LDGLLRQRGKKSALDDLMKINKLVHFLDDLLKGKEIDVEHDGEFTASRAK